MKPPNRTEQAIDACREKFEAGDKAALLDALDFCARCGMLPLWIANAYIAGYEDWVTLRAHSLDAAFKVARKGRKIAHLARRRRLTWPVLVRIELLRRRKMRIDLAFEEVGQDLGISAKTVERIYYDPANQGWRALLSKLKPLSVILRKS